MAKQTLSGIDQGDRHNLQNIADGFREDGAKVRIHDVKRGVVALSGAHKVLDALWLEAVGTPRPHRR